MKEIVATTPILNQLIELGEHSFMTTKTIVTLTVASNAVITANCLGVGFFGAKNNIRNRVK